MSFNTESAGERVRLGLQEQIQYAIKKRIIPKTGLTSFDIYRVHWIGSKFNREEFLTSRPFLEEAKKIIYRLEEGKGISPNYFFFGGRMYEGHKRGTKHDQSDKVGKIEIVRQ